MDVQNGKTAAHTASRFKPDGQSLVPFYRGNTATTSSGR